jgi:methylenetetrahydrofolate dehydrogenase (NADP+) / methenyltetrahydrofolate cyclohydrolase
MKDIRPCRKKTPAHRTVPTRFRQGYEGRVLECAPFGARCGDFRMQTRIIDGKAIARELRGELLRRIANLVAKGTRPGLAMVRVGDHPASSVYVRNKLKACDEVGLYSQDVQLPGTAEESAILGQVEILNNDPRIHGILVQLPLPSGLTAQRVFEAIDPTKDVDGFHPTNVGLLAVGQPRFVPCTPLGVARILDHEGIGPEGRHAVVVGRSIIVGRPMAHLLLQKGATVTVCNSKTPDLGSMTRQAEILVVAAGKPRLVTANMIKPGAVVIDVGINRLADGKLAGDVDFQGALGTASRITPVPGGVGPMTIAMLLENTVASAERYFAADG